MQFLRYAHGQSDTFITILCTPLRDEVALLGPTISAMHFVRVPSFNYTTEAYSLHKFRNFFSYKLRNTAV